MSCLPCSCIHQLLALLMHPCYLSSCLPKQSVLPGHSFACSPHPNTHAQQHGKAHSGHLRARHMEATFKNHSSTCEHGAGPGGRARALAWAGIALSSSSHIISYHIRLISRSCRPCVCAKALALCVHALASVPSRPCHACAWPVFEVSFLQGGLVSPTPLSLSLCPSPSPSPSPAPSPWQLATRGETRRHPGQVFAVGVRVDPVHPVLRRKQACSNLLEIDASLHMLSACPARLRTGLGHAFTTRIHDMHPRLQRRQEGVSHASTTAAPPAPCRSGSPATVRRDRTLSLCTN